MDWHCQKFAAVGYWAGVIVVAVAPHAWSLTAGWIVCQVFAAVAG
jgi:hypothetical protein